MIYKWCLGMGPLTQFGSKAVVYGWSIFFSCKSNSTITNVRLSVCQSVSHRNPSASQNSVYLLLSLSFDLSNIRISDIAAQISLIYEIFVFVLSDIWSLKSCLLSIAQNAYWPSCPSLPNNPNAYQFSDLHLQLLSLWLVQ